MPTKHDTSGQPSLQAQRMLEKREYTAKMGPLHLVPVPAKMKMRRASAISFGVIIRSDSSLHKL